MAIEKWRDIAAAFAARLISRMVVIPGRCDRRMPDMETSRRSATSHLTFNASGNPHAPGDFVSGYLVTCRGCEFRGSRWEYLEHLHELGFCWACYGLGIFKFRVIAGHSYDYACSKCGGTGTRTAPLPPRPKDSPHGLGQLPAA
jgi:hypothetical protein